MLASTVAASLLVCLALLGVVPAWLCWRLWALLSLIFLTLVLSVLVIWQADREVRP